VDEPTATFDPNLLLTAIGWLFFGVLGFGQVLAHWRRISLSVEFEIALAVAQRDASRRGQPLLPEHFLFAALFDEGVAASVLASGTTPAALREALAVHLDGAAPAAEPGEVADASPEFVRMIRVAYQQVMRSFRPRVTLLGALEALSLMNGSFAAALLAERGVRLGRHAPAAVPRPRAAVDTAYRAPGAGPDAAVVIWNDDRIAMEHVMDVLRETFARSEGEATHLMLTAHHKGRAAVGVYPLAEAVALAEAAAAAARERRIPLRFSVERDAPGARRETFA
jgi:ATP-dependent Clp protease adaptor protein ClpS